MKLLHTVFLLLLSVSSLLSQSVEVDAVLGNPLLRSNAAREAIQQAAIVEDMTGNNPLEMPSGDRSATCPLEFTGNIVESGDLLEITVDTFGLMKGTGTVTLTIDNGGSLSHGTATFNDTTLLLSYTADPTFDGAGEDTVLIRLQQPGHDTVMQVFFFVKRKGRVIVAPMQTVAPQSITTYCLANGVVDLPRPRDCGFLTDVIDSYDGAGQQFFHFAAYGFPDTCVVYYSTRFPGVDTISITICDEWAVCDVFKIPFRIPGDTLSIATQPFFEDFSSHAGPHTSASRWLDRDVYVNSTLAKNPPSVGFATFDGLNRKGDVIVTNGGVGDRLTSKAIDLSSLTPSSNVYLRFYLAPKGYGLEPEEEDEMTLEFRNADRLWVKVGTYQGTGDIPIDSFPPFLFYPIKVDDPQFFHEAFQFRFSAKTSPGGPADLWHLDYIHLGKNESDSDNFNDVAFTRPPSSILKNYTSMPFRQFDGYVAGEVIDQLTSGFFNHFDGIRALNDSRVSMKETTTNNGIATNFTVVETGTDNNLEEKTHIERLRNLPAASLMDGIIANLETIQSGDFRNLQTQYVLTMTEQADLYKHNDTVRLDNPFADYFAHDDGTAEWQVFVKHAAGGEKLVSRFHANKPDTIKAVQILFPHVNGDVTNQFFNLHIWAGSLDTDPIFSRQLLRPIYPNVYYDTLQGYTTYLLDNFLEEPVPVGIDSGDFYVGIEQVTATTSGIPIGFDLQNPCDCNFMNISGTWLPLPSSFQGAMMIRPMVSSAYTTGTASAGEQFERENHIVLAPNPSTGEVNVKLENASYQDFELTIFNNLGQLVWKGTSQPSLDLGHLQNGLYHLQFMDKKTGNSSIERLILTK